jgi:hypothetical protein
MVGVTSDASAKFVRQACLGQISMPIAPEALSIQATAAMRKGQYDDDNYLYVTVQNKSPYAITEMMIRVATENDAKWNDYEVTNFFQVTRYVVAALPPDPSAYLQIKPFSTVYFCGRYPRTESSAGQMELAGTSRQWIFGRSMSSAKAESL